MVNALIFPVTDVDTLKRYFYFVVEKGHEPIGFTPEP
jgi:hypothetical protein